ncbi:MAG: FAD-dependent oxidoreductase, partial [Pseudomonadota bacterium]
MDQTLAPSAWHGSLWREAPDHQSNPPLQDNIQVDVAVVGAGFTGLRAATRLAEAGRSVAVLDAQDVGWGASGRSGGQVNPMLPVNSPDQIRALVGERAFSNISKASLRSADELFELIETYQIRCDARQNGWLRVLHSEKALRQAEKDHKNWNAIGGEMQLIEGAEVERLSGSLKYKAGVVTKRGGAVHPFKLVCGLAQVAKAAGVQIFGQSPVQRTERSGDHWVATTPEGQVTAEWIVVATNGYTDALVPGLARSIIPVTPIQIA